MTTMDYRILLVTATNPQSKLFIEHLQHQLDHEVIAVDTEAMPSMAEDEVVLVILDLDHLSEASMQKWQNAADGKENVSLAAFNVRDEGHAVELLSSLNLQGIFYRNDSVDLICKGIEALRSGNLWMSRTLMSRMIQLLRRQQMNSYRPACGLTQRELEIIGLLGTGATNSEIAEKLFVSEHTVKSHLYNIFRKIKVHNRLQAMNWARRNLFSVPPSYKRESRH
ncbi:MAG: LuxR C-terminal-related transcriptional regulator [Halomonas sp.]|mgnify:CR=1 FL=1|jgi:DNA-binding NarL/FixJ family response regulator|uniref:DNA-binding response regulator n=1 Tax=Billgrantia tianxiuensis TaxID=2497861 RepID=A0A6I6SPX3_9GAMM|nr:MULTISPECIES: LuxR C-terminal-related transcriptional regulator [Halomonas]MCE8035211.1 DNA-binding response regulator [Halomonas sp. MCCC 1A11057]MDX5435508.1 LuxR C-terminal-related transcriptional regulator [Halomonas sp.]QHC51972.1 DNA-binding response regulator [Halomonas tianxiuensis]